MKTIPNNRRTRRFLSVSKTKWLDDKIDKFNQTHGWAIVSIANKGTDQYVYTVGRTEVGKADFISEKGFLQSYVTELNEIIRRFDAEEIKIDEVFTDDNWITLGSDEPMRMVIRKAPVYKAVKMEIMLKRLARKKIYPDAKNHQLILLMGDDV